MALLWPVLRPVWPGLALGLAVLAALFAAEGAAAVHVWNTSTAYGHCWLVLPLAAWLAWDRRFTVAGLAPRPVAAPALLAVPLIVAWLAADLLGIMEGRQLAAIGFLEILLLAVLGPRLWWALAAALLYLFFLVPFGAFLTPWLQDVTARFVALGMDVLGIPGEVTQFRIEIPEGGFYVAEACAGLRFLIASVAFGVLYAVTLFRSPLRRAVFIAVSVAVPIVANGIRALGIVLLGHTLGSAEAAATDHILYGWIFFSIVILLLALAGMPFRQDMQAPPPVPAQAPPRLPGARRAALRAALPVVLLAAIGPAIAAWINRPAPAPDAQPVLITPPGCALRGTEARGPVFAEEFTCGFWRVAARLEIVPRGANPSHVTEAGFGQAVILAGGGDLDGGVLQIEGATPRTWLLQRDRESARAAAAALIIDGAPALGGLHDRIRLMGDLLRGTGQPTVAMAIAVHGADKGDPEAALQDFLSAQGNLARRMAALADTSRR